jgi:hypothetical protein
VRGISDLVIAPGLINVDFADVRTIMTGMGRALMGTGRGHGDKRAVEAAQQAISSPLLEDVSINGATGILLNITGGPDLTLAEMNEACSLIAEAADPDANIIFGSVIDAHAGDEVRITVIATGFQSRLNDQPAPTPGARVSSSSSNGNLRRPVAVDQMPLPMHSGGLGHNLTSPATIAQTQALPTAQTPPAWSQPAGPTPRGGYAAPRQEPEAIDIEDFYAGTEYGAAPSVPMPNTPSAPTYNAANPPMGLGVAPNNEWTPAERPIIRPPVAPATAASAVPPGRRAGNQVSARPADELGVEESEFDKPTYLRRGIFAPE